MSPMAADNEILSDDNYFFWEFNARMKLARKYLLQFIDGPVDIKEEDLAAVVEWKAKDLKAFAILSAMIST